MTKSFLPLEQRMSRALEDRRAASLFRTLGNRLNSADFSSNDYLGVARRGFTKCVGTLRGATGSRLLTGNLHEHEAGESYLAEFFGAQAALLFGSGYSANLGLLAALAEKRGCSIVYDELCHASIRDGLRLGFSAARKFRHNSPDDLAEKLRRSSGPRIVVVESLYSMDGDIAPLAKICEVCAELEAALIVDEAHSAGVYGRGGRGLVAEFNLEGFVFARVVTFGKAFGYHGAVVLGSTLLRDFIVNASRPFIYSTAQPGADAEVIVGLCEQVAQLDAERMKLRSNVELFTSSLSSLSREMFTPSSGHIQTVRISGNERVREASRRLQSAGFDVRAILHPTVPAGGERLRVSLHSFNTEDEIHGLAKQLKKDEG